MDWRCGSSGRLLCKYEALSSNPSLTREREKERDRERKREQRINSKAQKWE
jgi:hypothetical protein